MTSSPKALLRIIRVAVCVLLMALVYRQVDLRELQTLLLSARWELLLAAFALLYANTALSAFKWGLFLRADGINIRYFKLLNSYLIAGFMNLFLPSNIGGDAYRVVDITRRSHRAAGTFASILADRLTGLTALVILGMGFSVVSIRVLDEKEFLLLPLLAMMFLAALIVALRQQRLVRGLVLRSPLRKLPIAITFVDTLLQSVALYDKSPRLIARALAISFVFQGNVILTIFMLSRAMELDTPFLYICTFIPLISLIEAIPISVYGLGIRDISYAFFFTAIGVARVDALALALAYVLVSLLYSTLGGLLLLWRMAHPPISDPTVVLHQTPTTSMPGAARKNKGHGRSAASTARPLRIGIMARSYDEKGGIGVYTRNIIHQLLRIDSSNQYFLYYQNPAFLGSHTHRENVTERVVPGTNKLWWDQVSMPRAARQDDLDLIFHTKFTIPLFARAKRVMVVHGADWFLPEYAANYNQWDVRYIRAAMPLYFRACERVLSVSDYSTQSFADALPRYKDRLVTTYFAPHAAFKPIADRSKLDEVRRRYRLPEHFILTVIRYDPQQPNTRKNAGNMLKAFALLKKSYRIPHRFVVVGKDCERFGIDYRIDALGIANDVVFPGLVQQEDLPAFYNLASLYLYPTFIEAFPIPITEAMSCGTPIVTSHGTGLEELAGNAALKVNPHDPAEIAEAAHRILTDEHLAQSLRLRGLERAKIFSWERCARQTLAAFEEVAGSPAPRSSAVKTPTARQ